MNLIRKCDIKMRLYGLQQPVNIDILKSFLPNRGLEMFTAVLIDAPPEMVSWFSISKQYVEKSYGSFFLTLRLHLFMIDSFSLVEDTILHVKSEKWLHTSRRQFTLQYSLQPYLMRLFVDETQMPDIESIGMQHIS